MRVRKNVTYEKYLTLHFTVSPDVFAFFIFFGFRLEYDFFLKSGKKIPKAWTISIFLLIYFPPASYCYWHTEWLLKKKKKEYSHLGPALCGLPQ